MPAVAPSVLVNAVLNAIQQSGGAGAYTSSSDRDHPRRFAVQYREHSFTIWVYIWTVTHGGRATLPHEYRIQMTSVQSPLQMNPNGYTVLMGYYPDLEMFTGFDLERHQTFTTGSPSIQIDLDTIHEALQNGLAFSIKNNEELAIGVRPDQFLNYVCNARAFHRDGIDRITFDLLETAAKVEAVTQENLETLSDERRKIVSEVERYARSANFRTQILSAYDNRCAVTRAQLRLVEAAHILPVAAPGSNDNVTNGLALSPTFHRAYDNCLIYLDETYTIKLNEEKAKELKTQNLHAGLPQFVSFLNKRIHLPADKNQWPDPAFIREANRFRRISV